MPFPDVYPTVVIAGKSFTIPPLSARSIIKFTGKINLMRKSKPNEMDEATMLAVYEAAYVGIVAAAPGLKFDEFMSWPITFDEVVNAVTLIGPMAGMEPRTPAGEAKAEAPTSILLPSTASGTEQSPMS